MLFWYVLKNQEGTTFDYALIIKARDRSRTDNLIITNDVLRQLSYAGNKKNLKLVLYEINYYLQQIIQDNS